MKKRFYLCMLALVLMFSSNLSMASSGKDAIRKKVEGMTEEQITARYEEMQQRVQEIKAMDKSSLTKMERKDIKKELKEMNQEARVSGNGGIYLSVGAILLIILILILIL
jgi:hypothetical protein